LKSLNLCPKIKTFTAILYRTNYHEVCPVENSGKKFWFKFARNYADFDVFEFHCCGDGFLDRNDDSLKK